MTTFLILALIAATTTLACWLLRGRLPYSCVFLFVPWLGSVLMFPLYSGTEIVPWELSDKTSDLVIWGLAAAAAGLCCGCLWARAAGSMRVGSTNEFYAWHAFIYKWGIAISTAYALVGLAALMINLVRFNFSLNYIRMAHTGFATGGETIGYVSVLSNYITTTAFPLLAMAVLGMVQKAPRSGLVVILLLVAFAAQAISVGGRIYLVVPIVFAAAAVAVVPGGVQAALRMAGWRLGIGALVVAYLFNAVIVLRGGLGEFKIADTFTNLGGKTLLAPFVYNTASIASIDIHADAVASHASRGYFTLDGPYRLLAKFGLLQGVVGIDYFGLSEMTRSTNPAINKAGWSQPGAIPKLISDFGFVGMLAGLFIFCAASSVVVERGGAWTPSGVTFGAWLLVCCAYTMQSVHWLCFQSFMVYISIAAWAFVVRRTSHGRPVPRHMMPHTHGR